MSSETTESRLRDALATVADDTSPTLEFDQIVTRIDSTVGPTTDHRRNRLLAAAGLLVVVASSFAWLRANNDEAFDLDSTDSTDTSQIQEELPDPSLPFVLPGEVVVSEDPLIVHAAEGPEPQFDTSGLGEEASFLPIVQTDIDQVLDRVSVEESGGHTSHIKTILLGRVGFTSLTVGITDQPDGDDTVRCRTLRSPGGSSGPCVVVDPEGLELIRPGPISSGPGSAVTLQEGLTAWSRLPSEASVAVVETESEVLWQRPRNGVTAFHVEVATGDSILFRVLDTSGEELYRGRFVVEDDDSGGFIHSELIYIGPESTDGRFDEATPPLSSYVLEGEEVLNEDPLIVQAAMGPEPEFDTSELGTEIAISPVEDHLDPRVQVLLGEWREQALAENPETVPIKFVVVGRATIAGRTEADEHAESDGLIVIGISDHRLGTALDLDGVSPETNVRARWVHTPEVGFGFGDRADRSSLTLISFSPYASTTDNRPVYTSGASEESFVWDEVPSNVSIVILKGADQQLWTRPHAGLAYFVIDPDTPRPQTLIALDAQGDELFRTTLSE